MVSKLLKKLSFFIFICLFGFTLNLLSQTHSKAVDALTSCAKDGSGRITIDDDDDGGVNAYDDGDQTYTDGESNTVKAPFNYANGHVDSEFSTNNTDQCSQEPDEYKVKFYQVSLCTEDPYKEADSPDFTSCTDIFNNTEGKDVTIIPDVDVDLIEGAIQITTGSYSYAAVIISNHLKIKHVQQFILESGAAPALYGFGDDGTNNGTDICYSRDVVTTFSGSSDLEDAGATANAYNASQGLANGTIKASSAGATTAQLACTDSLTTANNNAVFATEIFDHMGDESNDTADHKFNYPYETSGYDDMEASTGVAGIGLAVTMLKDDNLTSATAKTNAKRMAAFFQYDNPVRISEQTIGLKLLFTTYSSVSIDFEQDDDNKIWGVKMGADPFTIQFKTKTKRRKRTWR